jgi:hypothetical protein
MFISSLGEAEHHAKDGGRLPGNVKQTNPLPRDVCAKAQQCQVRSIFKLHFMPTVILVTFCALMYHHHNIITTAF